MANSAHWYGHVLLRENGQVLRRALNFEVEGQKKKGKPKRTWKKQVEEESVKIGLRRKDVLCRLKWSKSDCCWVEVNLATLKYWGQY